MLGVNSERQLSVNLGTNMTLTHFLYSPKAVAFEQECVFSQPVKENMGWKKPGFKNQEWHADMHGEDMGVTQTGNSTETQMIAL